MSEASATTAMDRLKKAFSEALNLPAGTDYAALAYAVTPGWDSVAHMALVAEIENTFDIMFSTDDVIGMSTFAIAQETVARHGVVF
jgi:acyl carrier protein